MKNNDSLEYNIVYFCEKMSKKNKKEYNMCVSFARIYPAREDVNMRIKHSKESSYVQQYIQYHLEKFELIHIKQLCIDFNYSASAIRTLLKKMDENYAHMSNLTIVKVAPGVRKLDYIENINYGNSEE